MPPVVVIDVLAPAVHQGAPAAINNQLSIQSLPLTTIIQNNFYNHNPPINQSINQNGQGQGRHEQDEG
jgi:hypothetical protein